MRGRHLLTAVAALSAPAAACVIDVTTIERYADEWQVEVDAPFPYRQGDGTFAITGITIGGAAVDENFENRGDVIVTFDGKPGRIQIEMRRFSWQAVRNDAERDFDRIHLWAYTGANTPRPPDEMDPDDRCATMDDDTGKHDPWRNACEVRLYYDGDTQSTRIGADFRLKLPPEYRHLVAVVTTDNANDDAHPQRSDVCVEGLRGSVDITLGAGDAFVSLADDVTPKPTCSDVYVRACEGWQRDGDPAAWAPGCPCTDAPWGATLIDTAAGNATIDLPPDLWSSVLLDGGRIGHDEDPLCDTDLDWPNDLQELPPTDANVVRAELNRPGDSAPIAGGYTARASCRDGLSTVLAAQDTDGQPPVVGSVRLCSRCVSERSCADLLAD